MIGHGTDRLGKSICMSTELRERSSSRYSKAQVGTESREENEFGVETRDDSIHVPFMAVFVKYYKRGYYTHYQQLRLPCVYGNKPTSQQIKIVKLKGHQHRRENQKPENRTHLVVVSHDRPLQSRCVDPCDEILQMS